MAEAKEPAKSKGQIRAERRKAMTMARQSKRQRRPRSHRTQYEVRDAAGQLVAIGRTEREARGLADQSEGLTVVRSRERIEGARQARDVTREIEQRRSDIAAIQPFIADENQLDVQAALEAGVTPEVLRRLDIPDASIQQARLNLVDLAAVAPYTSGNQIDLAAALEAGVDPAIIERLGISQERITEAVQLQSDLAAIAPFRTEDGRIDIVRALEAGIDTSILERLELPTEVPAPGSALPEAPDTLPADHVNRLRDVFGQAQRSVLRGVSGGQDLNNALRLARLRIDEFWREFGYDVAGLRSSYESQLRFYPRAIASAEAHIRENLERQRRTGEDRSYNIQLWQERIEEQLQKQAETQQQVRDFDQYVRDLRPQIGKVLDESYAAIPGIVGNVAGAERIADPTRATPELQASIRDAGGIEAAIASGALERQEAVSLGVANQQIDDILETAQVAGQPTAIELRAMPSEEAEAIRIAPDSVAQRLRDQALFDDDEARRDQEAFQQRIREEGVLSDTGTAALADLGYSPEEIAEIQGRERRVQLSTELDRVSQERLALGEAPPPAVGLDSPSAARAFSQQGITQFAQERQARQALIAQQGIPEDILAEQSRVEAEGARITQDIVNLQGNLTSDAYAQAALVERQARLIGETIQYLESGDLSVDEARAVIQSIPDSPSEQDIANAERTFTGRLRVLSASPIIGVPFGVAATVRDWEDSTNAQRATDVGLDALGVVAIAIPAVASARGAGALTTGQRLARAGRASLASEIEGPIDLILDPAGSAKALARTLTSPIEAVISRGQRLPASIEQARQTLRFAARPGAAIAADIGVAPLPPGAAQDLVSGAYTPDQVKEAVSEATLQVIRQGRPASVQIGSSGSYVHIEPGLLQKVLGQGATSASPDIRQVIGEGYTIAGREGGSFFSVSPHTRFADSTSVGGAPPSLNEITRLQDIATRLELASAEGAAEARKAADDALAAWQAFDDRLSDPTRQLIEELKLPNDPLPGIILINDADLLAQLRGAEALGESGRAEGVVIGDPSNVPKLFKGKAEVEAVLPNDVFLPKASQVLYFRGAEDGKRYGIAVIGKPITQAQLAQIGLRGPGEAVLNTIRPPIAVKFADIDVASDTLARARRLRDAGRIDEALALERQAQRLVNESTEAANTLRASEADDWIRQADLLDADARALRAAGELQRADDLFREADNLRSAARVYQTDIADVRAVSAIRQEQIVRGEIDGVFRGRSSDGSRDIGLSSRLMADRIGDQAQAAGRTVDRQLAPVARLETTTVRLPQGIARAEIGRAVPGVPAAGLSRSPRRTAEAPRTEPQRQGGAAQRFDARIPESVDETLPAPREFSRDANGDQREGSARLHLRTAGINRGIFDTTVDFTSGEVNTVPDLTSVPEIPTRQSFTPLDYSEATPQLQRIPWGANDLILGPFGSFKWIRANAPLPNEGELLPASEFNNGVSEPADKRRGRPFMRRRSSGNMRRRGRGL